MYQRPLKTQEDQVEFIRRFGEIVKTNDSLNGKYMISFAYIAGVNRIFITDKTGKTLDNAHLMSKSEYVKYGDLLNWWNH